jgi:hypothetical protein
LAAADIAVFSAFVVSAADGVAVFATAAPRDRDFVAGADVVGVSAGAALLTAPRPAARVERMVRDARVGIVGAASTTATGVGAVAAAAAERVDRDARARLGFATTSAVGAGSGAASISRAGAAAVKIYLA